MSIIKRSLTKSEMAGHLARSERMLATGVNIQIREEWQDNARAHGQTLDIAIGGGCATFVFDLTAGRAGYVISLRLVGRALGTVLDCRLTTSWDENIVLASFGDDGSPLCRLGLVEYPASQVLNQRIENSLRIHSGQTIEGVILATGVNPIPQGYRHGLIVPITLTFLDQNERQLREDAELFVDRMWKPKRKFVRRGSGLYDRGRIGPKSEPVIGQDRSVPRAPGREATAGKDAPESNEQ